MQLVHINSQLDHISQIIRTLKALLQGRIAEEENREVKDKKSHSEHS